LDLALRGRAAIRRIQSGAALAARAKADAEANSTPALRLAEALARRHVEAAASRLAEAQAKQQQCADREEGWGSHREAEAQLCRAAHDDEIKAIGDLVGAPADQAQRILPPAVWGPGALIRSASLMTGDSLYVNVRLPIADIERLWPPLVAAADTTVASTAVAPRKMPSGRRRGTAKKAEQRDKWIRDALARGDRPGETISWDVFERKLRDGLGIIADKERGFGPRHLVRRVESIRKQVKQ
jgi:hypothetical protein